MRTGLEGKGWAQAGARGTASPMAASRLDKNKRRGLKEGMAMILINEMR
jgi:hypothetical protein